MALGYLEDGEGQLREESDNEEGEESDNEEGEEYGEEDLLEAQMRSTQESYARDRKRMRRHYGARGVSPLRDDDSDSDSDSDSGKRMRRSDDESSSFAVLLANRVIGYDTLASREAAKLKAQIPGIMSDLWNRQREAALGQASAGARKCWWRFRFLRFTYYTPTIKDVEENLPDELKPMHQDRQLTVTRTNVGYPDSFCVAMDVGALVDGRTYQMKEGKLPWPRQTAVDRERIKKRRAEWEEADRQRVVKVKALKAHGWYMRHDPNGKTYYTKGADVEAARQWEWPNQVSVPNLAKSAKPKSPSGVAGKSA
jgi:hypothetical protein